MAPSTVCKVRAPALMKSWFLIKSVVVVAFVFFPFPTVGVQQKLCSGYLAAPCSGSLYLWVCIWRCPLVEPAGVGKTLDFIAAPCKAVFPDCWSEGAQRLSFASQEGVFAVEKRHHPR